MGDAEYTFAQARARLEDIVGQVRKKDMSLESSLDLLEEGVRLANACTEQIDQSEWRVVIDGSPSTTGVEFTDRSTSVSAINDDDEATLGVESPPAQP